MPQFNALNGRELKNYILAQIDKAIDNSGEFPQGLAFPWIKYDFRLNVVVYPTKPMDAEEGIVVKGEAAVDNAPKAKDAELVHVGFQEIIDTPDQARVDSNQPIPVPVEEHGHMVDKLVDRPVDIKKLVPPTRQVK